MQVKLKDIKANPQNPRTIKDDKFKSLCKSLTEFPDMLNKRPLVCFTDTDGKYVVLGGNMRLKAAKEIGLKELPIVLADDWNEEQKKEFLIKDNVGFGDWNYDELKADWDVQQLQDWGLEVPNFEAEVLEAEEDNYEIPDEIKTDIVLGDLFEIGEHRLLCGDSTDSDQVAKLMNGQKADMAHNDPPYGMKKEKDGVLNDNLNFNDLLEFNRNWITLQFTHLKENGSWYCWGIDEPLMDIYSDILKAYIAEQKATFRNLITWDKGNGQGQNSENTRSYAIADEKCLFVMMGVQGFARDKSTWYEGFEKFRKYYEVEAKKAGLNISKVCDLTNSYAGHYFAKSQYSFPKKEHHKKIQEYCIKNKINAFGVEYEEIKKEYEEIKKEYYSTRAYFNNTHDNFNNVWKFDRHKRQGDEGGHATPKPILLCERAIKSSCPDDGLVLDFFLGSGSTMVASHQLNRKCYGMELDPKYCQVIVDRMLKLDPAIKIKKNGKDYDKR